MKKKSILYVILFLSILTSQTMHAKSVSVSKEGYSFSIPELSGFRLDTNTEKLNVDVVYHLGEEQRDNFTVELYIDVLQKGILAIEDVLKEILSRLKEHCGDMPAGPYDVKMKYKNVAKQYDCPNKGYHLITITDTGDRYVMVALSARSPEGRAKYESSYEKLTSEFQWTIDAHIKAKVIKNLDQIIKNGDSNRLVSNLKMKPKEWMVALPQLKKLALKGGSANTRAKAVEAAMDFIDEAGSAAPYFNEAENIVIESLKDPNPMVVTKTITECNYAGFVISDKILSTLKEEIYNTKRPTTLFALMRFAIRNDLFNIEDEIENLYKKKRNDTPLLMVILPSLAYLKGIDSIPYLETYRETKNKDIQLGFALINGWIKYGIYSSPKWNKDFIEKFGDIYKSLPLSDREKEQLESSFIIKYPAGYMSFQSLGSSYIGTTYSSRGYLTGAAFLMELGRLDEAKTEIQKAIDLMDADKYSDPSFKINAVFILGMIEALQGNTSKAVETYSHAIDMDGKYKNYINAYYGPWASLYGDLADLYEFELNQPAKAKEIRALYNKRYKKTSK